LQRLRLPVDEKHRRGRPGSLRLDQVDEQLEHRARVGACRRLGQQLALHLKKRQDVIRLIVRTRNRSHAA